MSEENKKNEDFDLTVEKSSEPEVETVSAEPEVETVSAEPEVETVSAEPEKNQDVVSLLDSVSDEKVGSRIKFEEFTDEKTLLSYNAFGSKQMKIKVLEVSDENPVLQWKFGDRVKITKILVTIKHLTTQEIEEGEFDIEEIELELSEKRHYSSTNRWVPVNEIKNGYVARPYHTRLISDASALDYIIF